MRTSHAAVDAGAAWRRQAAERWSVFTQYGTLIEVTVIAVNAPRLNRLDLCARHSSHQPFVTEALAGLRQIFHSFDSTFQCH